MNDDLDLEDSSEQLKPSQSSQGNVNSVLNSNNAEKDDEDLSVPRAALNKMIKELLPSVRVANEARELVLNCCTEFIHFVATEANDVCNKQQKKTISHEHVYEALSRLGFQRYKEATLSVIDETKNVAWHKRQKKSKIENSGIPEEQLNQIQQDLFAKARMELAVTEQQEWQEMQDKLMHEQQQQHSNNNNNNKDDDDYNDYDS